MQITAKTIRNQLVKLKPRMEKRTLETIRHGQNMVGELMEARYRKQILEKRHDLAQFKATWILPRDERRQGVILYLHGGGYTCGGLEYAKGFGSMLAVKCGVRVFCAAYRLAPEHPFPAALEDALEAYRYLLQKGYPAAHITLCGESAGGGLCYALCLRLKELELPVPAGVIAISPWTDLTASGPSYSENREIDPTMTQSLLDFFASCYTADRMDPMVSPLFGDMKGMPPSLLFVGSDEIMRSDTTELHRKLLAAGCISHLTVAPERWHGYVLYDLQENQEDYREINRFLNRYMSEAHKLRWMPLDNAAKIYPATRRQNWSNVFRLSATLTEPVDVTVLQSALDVTVRRFPSIATRLRRGMFWYYLQQISQAPRVRQEHSYPLVWMPYRELRQCAFRVIVYENRIAVEFFHSLTDGNGGLVFLKTLLAEYVQQKYGAYVPAEYGVLGRLEEPSEEELEDSFLRYDAPVNASRKETTAWQVTGTPEPDRFCHLTCFRLPVQAVLEQAHAHHVSLTNYLCAVLMQALLNMQRERVADRRRRKPIKVLIPVNLRKLFPSRTLRNFVLYTIPELDPRLGDYSFDEICRVIHHKMGLDINAKQMGKMIATNVNSERHLIIKLMPLFVKNWVMKAVFDAVGEKKSCMSMSNLGAVHVPEALQAYVQRFDFILGVQATAPYNCGVISFGEELCVNFIRNIRESELERHFYQVLQSHGVPVLVESNRPE